MNSISSGGRFMAANETVAELEAPGWQTASEPFPSGEVTRKVAPAGLFAAKR
jgi:hypothetical protein